MLGQTLAKTLELSAACAWRLQDKALWHQGQRDPIRGRVRGPVLEPATGQRSRRLRWSQKLQDKSGVPGVQGEAAATPTKRLLLSIAEVKAKVAVEATAKAVAEVTGAKHWSQKNGKGHKSSRNPSWHVAATSTDRDVVPFGSTTQKSTWVHSWRYRPRRSVCRRWLEGHSWIVCTLSMATQPGVLQNFAGKSLKFIRVVKLQCFSICRHQIERLARAMALDIHFAGYNMRASRHARTFLGSLWCPESPPSPQAGIHTYVRLTCKELAQAYQSHMLEDEPFSRNLSVLDKKAINWIRCNRWVRLIDTDKNLGTALVETQWIEDQVQLWLSKMTRRISEAEASQKIVTCVESLRTITERAIKSEIIEGTQRGFLLVNSNCTVAPSFRILAKIHKQPVSSRPIGNYRNFCLGTAGVAVSAYLQPVVESCRHVIGSHVPIINWAETAQLEEHDIMFTFDIEALYPSIRVWPGVGGHCLFDVVERAIWSFYSPQPDLVEFLSTQLTQYGGSFFEVTWGLSTGLQCASELVNLYLDVLGFPCVAEFERCS